MRKALPKHLTVLAISIALLLALPTAALAFLVFHGPVGSGAGDAVVDINVFFKHHHPVKLNRFEFDNVPVTCGNFAPSAYSYSILRKIVVSQGKFHVKLTANNGHVKIKVNGHFTSKTHAAGKLRITGSVPGCGTADSGVVHWSATKT